MPCPRTRQASREQKEVKVYNLLNVGVRFCHVTAVCWNLQSCTVLLSYSKVVIYKAPKQMVFKVGFVGNIQGVCAIFFTF